MVARGLAESRAQAQRLVMAGQVRVDGQVAFKPSQAVVGNAEIRLTRQAPYVSRGGEKLEAALQAFGVPVAGQVCADVGASTGGFTDCLLQRGAAKVYAIDVGRGILHWKLRQDPRVAPMEGTNARFLERLPEPIGLATVDASFISLRLLLPAIRGWFAPQGGLVIALVKPQFEAGRAQAARGEGVIRDAAIHRQALLGVLSSAQELGYGARGLLRSPLLGPKGNVEFLAHLEYPGGGREDLESLLEGVIPAPPDAG